MYELASSFYLIIFFVGGGYGGFQMGKVIPKRKQWKPDQTRGPKRVKLEVKSTQTDADCLPAGVSQEAHDLMVKGTLYFTTLSLLLGFVLNFCCCCRNSAFHLLENSCWGASRGIVQRPPGEWEGELITESLLMVSCLSCSHALS